MADSAQLEGKVAIVTGAARGLGAVIARVLAEHGAFTVLGDVLEEEGRAVASALRGRARFERLDVSSEDDWQRVVARILDEQQRVDVLVNNAAILHLGPVESTTPEVFRRLHEVNTLGPFLGLRAVAPPMREQGGGSVINISSIDALSPLNGLSAYAASKWGLRGMTKSVALELGSAGIRVNCVCPADGGDDMAAPWADALDAMSDQVAGYVGNRGTPGPAPLDVIAQAVVFLASDASTHCNGIDLPVDGGASIGHVMPGLNRF
jgi:3alpha(or 20beta)-hydroxysteroid dehydrogenase